MKTLLPFLLACTSLSAAMLQHAGEPVTMTLSEVSENTFEVRLQRAAATDFKLPADASLPDLPRKILWQGASLDSPSKIDFGIYQIHISPTPLTLEIRRGEKSIQTLRWQADGKTLSFRTDTPTFGLGGGGPGFDRRGNVFSMKDGWGAYKRETHGSRVAIPYLISPGGWSLFFNHLPGQLGEFDLTNSASEYRPDASQDALPVNLFVSLADDPRLLVGERGKIEGNAPLPPRWALGYMQSHRTLASAEQVREVAQTFRDHQLPCDALIYLGTGYCPAGWNRGHGSLDFNNDIFPEPRKMLDDLHRLHFKVVLHANQAPAGLHGTTIAPDGGDSIGSYWESHLPAFSTGADAWWPDDGDELSTNARVARHRAYQLGPQRERPDERPWSLHRTGYLGVQKFGGWMWSGDPFSLWETLQAQVAVGLNHSISLSPFWGSDTGGFIPTAELTSELYVRWFQFSCFTPSFRSHGRAWQLRLPWGWNTGTLGPIEDDGHFPGLPVVEDTFNPGIEPICKKYLHLRYQLLSYNYTLAHEASVTGVPMMRPLWMVDATAPTRGDEFLWGQDLLVAPVVEKGATSRTLWLPAGGWYDFWTGTRVEGGREITRPADLATLPIYVRAGAILPLDPVRQFTAEESEKPLTLRVFPGNDGHTTLYQDDGSSFAYRDGASRTLHVKWNDQARTLRVEATGNFTPTWPSAIRVECDPQGFTQEVVWDGKPFEIHIPAKQ
ncbi:MAG: TIM-barrel domain-containing protein [Verrucomicrobiota bacterium]